MWIGVAATDPPTGWQRRDYLVTAALGNADDAPTGAGADDAALGETRGYRCGRPGERGRSVAAAEGRELE